MGRSETKVRVRLDTRQAKGELQGFVRESARTAGKVAGGISAAVGRGIGLVGVGGLIGTGLAAVKGPVGSGIGDVLGEAFGGVGARISDWAMGDLAPEARASKSAREQTKNAFAMLAGMPGWDKKDAVGYYRAVHEIALQKEKGAKRIEMDPDFRYEEVVEKAATRVGTAVLSFLDKIWWEIEGAVSMGGAPTRPGGF